MSYIYDLPFGRGRALGANASGPVNWVISGWQTTAASGAAVMMLPDPFAASSSLPRG